MGGPKGGPPNAETPKRGQENQRDKDKTSGKHRMNEATWTDKDGPNKGANPNKSETPKGRKRKYDPPTAKLALGGPKRGPPNTKTPKKGPKNQRDKDKTSRKQFWREYGKPRKAQKQYQEAPKKEQ